MDPSRSGFVGVSAFGTGVGVLGIIAAGAGREGSAGTGAADRLATTGTSKKSPAREMPGAVSARARTMGVIAFIAGLLARNAGDGKHQYALPARNRAAESGR